MRLLSKNEYKRVEELLRSWRGYEEKAELKSGESYYGKAIKEIVDFFHDDIYSKFIKIFYFDRKDYKNRYPDNRSLFKYLEEKLFVQEPTLYVMRKDIVYKAAMIFYKYRLLKE